MFVPFRPTTVVARLISAVVQVAMTTPRYSPLVGGVEMHTEELARRIATDGTDVTILTLHHGAPAPVFEHAGHLTVQRFAAWGSRHDLVAPQALLRELRTGDYDLVHVQGVHTLLAPAVMATARRSGIPFVVTFHTGGHSSRIRTLLRGAQWRSMRALLRRAHGRIAVSAFEQRHFGQLLGLDEARIRIIANGADSLPVAEGNPPVTGRPLLTSVGRLERYKGHDHAIAAMPALLALAPDAHLAVVGMGPDERRLHRLVGRLGVEHAVTITSFGPQERPRLGSLVASSDVVVLLSDYEAHPIAVLEALGLGRKVVVADTSGLSELGGHQGVTVVDPRTAPDALAMVLCDAARAPAPAAVALPTWDRCASDTLAYYLEVLG